MTPQAHYDVVIIGGAAMGSSTAFFLAMNPDFDGSILLVERDTSFKYCSTALSVAGVRKQFSTAVNIQLSQFAAQFFKEIPDILGEMGESYDPGFHENGYLYLANRQNAHVLRENHVVQEGQDAGVLLLNADEIAKRFPFFNLDDIEVGAFGASGEGWYDAFGLMQAFRRAARVKGVDSIEDEVVSLTRTGSHLSHVMLKSGTAVSAGRVVNACGRHAAVVAEMAGTQVPIEPRKRSVFIIDCREELGQPLPLTIDTTGVFCRSEGNLYITGCAPVVDGRTDFDDFEIIYSEFDEIVWPSLAHRIPAFEAIKLVDAWAGHYEYNYLDQNAVIGLHTEIDNLYFIAGFSGHGVQQCAAAGRGMSELITYGEYRTIDLRDLGYERIARGEPFREKNII